MIPPVSAVDPTHRTNSSKYFIYDEDMITRGSICSVPAALGSNPKAVGPFNDSFIIDIAVIFDKMVAMFQVSDGCTYLKLAKKQYIVRMGYKLIYNHYLVPSNIYHMADGA